jgi:hypothetical protein
MTSLVGHAWVVNVRLEVDSDIPVWASMCSAWWPLLAGWWAKLVPELTRFWVVLGICGGVCASLFGMHVVVALWDKS